MPALLLCLLACWPQDPDSEKLKKFEKSVARTERRQDEKKPEEPRKKPSNGDDDDDDDDFFEAIFGSVVKLLVEFVAMPFRYAFSDQGMRFDDHPYAHGRRYFQMEPDFQKGAAFDAALTVGRVEHDLWSVGLGGTVRWASGCHFNFDVSRYTEEVEGGTDRLTLQEYAINFGARGRVRSFQLSFGLGLGVLNGEESTDLAPLIQVEFIHFPAEPVSVRWHAAILAFSGATVTDLRLDLGFHIDRFALTAGVRSLISSENEDLTGPTLGFAVFF